MKEIMRIVLVLAIVAVRAAAADLHVPSEYATIQSAVNAAMSGDTIRIAAGAYNGQVLIADKGDLTLLGEPGTVVRATTSMSQTLVAHGDPDSSVPLIGIARANVTLDGLIFDGAHLGGSFAPSQLRGVYFLGAGGTVTNCAIRGFRGVTLTR